MEHEICLSSWNINNSSVRNAFLRDVTQCQVDVACIRRLKNWHEDGAAGQNGWSLFQAEKVRKRRLLPEGRI